MARKKFLTDTTKFFAKHLTTFSVEDGAKSDIVWTFSPPSCMKRFRGAVATEFTTAGKTVDHIHVSETAGTITINVTVAFGAGASFNVVYNPVKKGDTVTVLTHNHVA